MQNSLPSGSCMTTWQIGSSCLVSAPHTGTQPDEFGSLHIDNPDSPLHRQPVISANGKTSRWSWFLPTFASVMVGVLTTSLKRERER